MVAGWITRNWIPRSSASHLTSTNLLQTEVRLKDSTTFLSNHEKFRSLLQKLGLLLIMIIDESLVATVRIEKAKSHLHQISLHPFVSLEFRFSRACDVMTTLRTKLIQVCE